MIIIGCTVRQVLNLKVKLGGLQLTKKILELVSKKERLGVYEAGLMLGYDPRPRLHFDGERVAPSERKSQTPVRNAFELLVTLGLIHGSSREGRATIYEQTLLGKKAPPVELLYALRKLGMSDDIMKEGSRRIVHLLDDLQRLAFDNYNRELPDDPADERLLAWYAEEFLGLGPKDSELWAFERAEEDRLGPIDKRLLPSFDGRKTSRERSKSLRNLYTV